MVKPLKQNYIESLRQWANEVIAGRVVTTPIGAAEIVLELLDHIKFQQDMYASEHYMRKQIIEHNHEIAQMCVALAEELDMPHSQLQAADKILAQFKSTIEEYRGNKKPPE